MSSDNRGTGFIFTTSGADTSGTGSMDTIVSVREKDIRVLFTQYAVRIKTDENLNRLLRHDVKKATAELVTAIKSKYQNDFGTAFKVSDRSMSVEIWGHAYADHLAKWIQRFSRISLINKITGKVINRCRLIDIGEKGHDNNRFFWDGLAPFLSLIAFFLP